MRCALQVLHGRSIARNREEGFAHGCPSPGGDIEAENSTVTYSHRTPAASASLRLMQAILQYDLTGSILAWAASHRIPV